MTSLLPTKLDTWSIDIIREDNGGAQEGGEFGVFLGSISTDGDTTFELGRAEEDLVLGGVVGGVGVGEGFPVEFDLDRVGGNVRVDDLGLGGLSEGIVDEEFVSEVEVVGGRGGGDLLAVNVLGESVHHMSLHDEMADEEKAQQSEEDHTDSTTDLRLSVA